MKARITFEVEPNTTYVYEVSSWGGAVNRSYELARMMRRKAWAVECDGVAHTFKREGLLSVQVA